MEENNLNSQTPDNASQETPQQSPYAQPALPQPTEYEAHSAPVAQPAAQQTDQPQYEQAQYAYDQSAYEQPQADQSQYPQYSQPASQEYSYGQGNAQYQEGYQYAAQQPQYEQPAAQNAYPAAGAAAGAGYQYQQPYEQPYQPQYQQPYQGAQYQGAQGYAYPPTNTVGYGYAPVGQKSKVAAGVLGIFLGCFGAHNFYLGYTGKAVAQLLITILTLGFGSIISGIWALIEAILILCSSTGSDWHRDAKGYELRD